jgi:hypothetical protein
LQGLDINWKEKLEVVNKTRKARMLVYGRIYKHDAGAMPSEGIA